MNESEPRFKTVLIVFLVSRIALEITGILSNFYFPKAYQVYKLTDLRYHQEQTPLIDIWARWDSEWWLMIAEQGYRSYDHYKDFGRGRYLEQETAKFFPAYPAGIKLLSFVTRNSIVAGILLSNLCTILFLYYFFKLASKLFDANTAFQASILYVVFPTSFFLSAVYSESLFLAAVVAAFYYIEEKQLGPAAIACAISVLTRSQAVMIIPALILLAWQRIPEQKWISAAVISAACALPLLAYLFFIDLTFGSIMWIPETIRYWRGELSYPLYAFVRFSQNKIAIHGQHNSLIDFSFAAVNLVVLALSFRRLKAPYILYSALMVLFPLMSTLFSFSRLCLANFPFFLLAGFLANKWSLPLQIFCAILMSFFMAAFANWFWVG